MAMHNTASRYGWTAKLLHWVMALMVIGMLWLGLYMDGMEMGVQKIQFYGWHKSIGSLVLALCVVRLAWKWITPTVAMRESTPRWQRISAKATHIALYTLMLCMPMSGWLMSSAYGFPVSVFGWFTLPNLVDPNQELGRTCKEIHELGMIAFFVLIGLHTLAAFKHHFIDKDATLRRMLPW